MDNLQRPQILRALQGSAAALLIGLLVSFVALASHRPAWCALGLLLLPALVWQGCRHDGRASRWVARGMALGPLALMLGLEFSHIGWGLAREATILAAAALFGGLSFIALRRRPAWAIAAMAWHLMLAVPIDVAYQPEAGGPLIQPLSVGLLTHRPTPEQAMQFVDAGCVGGGLEPHWVVTWQDSKSTP